MLVRMLTDAPGSPDGISVQEYSEGEIYDVTGALADAFVTHGFAELVEVNIELDTDEPDADDEPKMGEGPAENKSE